jgi:hypothetical protein
MCTSVAEGQRSGSTGVRGQQHLMAVGVYHTALLPHCGCSTSLHLLLAVLLLGCCVQAVVEAHFLMRAATDAETGALQVSAVQLSLVLANLAMPAAGPLVVDTSISVTWANATVPEAMLQVRYNCCTP